MDDSRSAAPPAAALPPTTRCPAFPQPAGWLLLAAALGIPVSLLWDFSWESTVGIDLVWAPPHVATYAAIALGGLVALACGFAKGRSPLGAWVVLWGAGAFVAAVLFDRWWQAGYGLAAGLWHPPQILKAAAFFAVLGGVWLGGARWQNHGDPGGAVAFAASGGLVLTMISVVTLISIYPNRQHSATFYQLACGTYPAVLVALATAGRLRFPATAAALLYLAVMSLMVWLLPLIPGQPQVAPIYNPRDHLMPPPFPLLLVAPALALDALLRIFPGREQRFADWRRAVECGLAFFLVFTAAQWSFAEFLLSPAADNRFFAGGGKHWPFFLKIDAPSRVTFWRLAHDEINFASGLVAAGLAVAAARVGLWVGAWMKRVQR